MTLRNILDMPFSDMWAVVGPFVTGYAILVGIFFLIVMSFFVYVFMWIAKE